jgi:hypothetical protein
VCGRMLDFPLFASLAPGRFWRVGGEGLGERGEGKLW